MDEDLARWILEFLIRKPIELRIIDNILSCLPIPNTDNRLKKTLLLKVIETKTSNGTISEEILDHLETIEELDHQEGKIATDSLKLAYCAVAVDCTARFLDRNVENNARYFEAVERVWRARVCRMKTLLSEESNRWLGEIEAAVWDSGVCGKIVMRDTKSEALKAVRVYLTECWGSLGPSFLEQVAEWHGKDLEAARGCGGKLVVGNPCHGEQDDPALVRRNVAIKGKRRRGVKISDADEGHEDETVIKSKCLRTANIADVGEANVNDYTNKGSAGPTPEVDGVEAAFIPSSVEQNAAVRNDLPHALQLSVTSTPSKATDNIDNNTAVENQTQPNVKTSAEMERVRNAQKTSSMELHAPVMGPLPEALDAAQACLSTVATDIICSKGVIGKSSEPETNAPRVSTKNDTESIKKKDNPTQGAQGQVQEGKDKPTQVSSGQVQEQKDSRAQDAHGQDQEQLDDSTQGSHDIEKKDNPTRGVYGQVQEGKGKPTQVSSGQVQEQRHSPAQDAHGQDQEQLDDSTQGSHDIEKKDNPTQGFYSQVQEGKGKPTQVSSGQVQEQKDSPAQDAHGQDAQGQVQEQRGLRKLPDYSLMKANETEQRFECNDSIDNISGDSSRRPSIPSPKQSKLNQLKTYVETNMTRRRVKRFWTSEEEEKLRAGVKKFGKGNWKLILNSYREVFQGRTEVDLKDKWRNLTRSR